MDLPIRIDPGSTIPTLAKIETGLHGVEDRAEKIGPAMSTGARQGSTALMQTKTTVDVLGRSFNSLGDAIRRTANQQMQRAQIQTDVLARSFGSLNVQLEREKAMLDRIHGPMNRLEEDMRTLDILHKRGALSAHQYADELARIGRNAGLGANPASVVALPGAPKAAAASAGMGLGGMAAGAGAFAGVAAGRSLIDLSDGYTRMSNRLKQVTTDHDHLNRMLERTRDVANRTGGEWETTIESYVKLRQATKGIGLSEERALRITETLGKALQASGASASMASAGMLQLMQAMGAGALQGDEFRSISENIPQLLDVFAKQLNVTRGALKKMGAEGKITTDIMIKGLEAFSAQADKMALEAVPTISSGFTRLKNDAKGTFLGDGFFSMDPAKNARALHRQMLAERDAMAVRREAIETIRLGTSTMGLNEQQLASLSEEMSGTSTALGKFTNAWFGFGGAVEKTDSIMEAWLRGSLMQLRQDLMNGTSPALNHVTHSLRNMISPLTTVIDLFDRGWGSGGSTIDELKFTNFMNGVNAAIEKQQDSLAKATADAAAYRKELEKLGPVVGRGFGRDIRRGEAALMPGTGFGDPRAVAGSIDRGMLGLDGALGGHSALASSPAAKMGAAADLTAKWNAELERTRSIQRDLAQGFGSIAGNIAQMALAGENFNAIISQLAQQLLSLFAQQAFTSIFGGSVGGGLSLGGIPGFASGGQLMVGGSGGPDSQLFAARVTPGERITIETPQQQARSDSGGGGDSAPINLAVHIGADDVVRHLQTPQGRQVIVRVIREMAPSLRGMLGIK